LREERLGGGGVKGDHISKSSESVSHRSHRSYRKVYINEKCCAKPKAAKTGEVVSVRRDRRRQSDASDEAVINGS